MFPMNFIQTLCRYRLPAAARFVRRRWRSGLLCLLLWSAGAGRAAAQDENPTEYQVKAAFLYNFGKFVTWPTNAFADAYAPLVIGVVGDNPFHGDLRRLVANKKIDGHLVLVRTVAAAADVKGCHIIFVSEAAQKSPDALLVALRQPDILTVTENIEHLAGSDFIINFVRKDNRIRFQINMAKAGESGLKISSKLLPLAETVEK
jgi:hypothetical protein